MRWVGRVVLLLPLVVSSVARADQPKEKPRLAVLPLSAKRLPKEMVEVLDVLLVGEVARYDRYTVIGSSDINAMLGLERMKEAVGCSDVSCAAEVGGALGVPYLLAGSASRLGRRIIVAVKLIDIRKTIVVARAQQRAKNDEDEYPEAIEKVVARLFGGARPPPPAAAVAAPGSTSSPSAMAPVPGAVNGDLWVESEPSGALVTVDDKPRGKTPLRVTELLGGQHKVVLSLEGHEPVPNIVTVFPGRATNVKAKMRLLAGSVIITAEPAGAACYLDGKEVGESPCQLGQIPIGEHTLAVKLPYHESATTTVDVGDRKSVTWGPSLKPLPVTVSFATNPGAAILRINGKEVGNTPKTLKLRPGKYEIEFELRGHTNERQTLIFDAGPPRRLDVKLNPGLSDPERRKQPVAVTISSNPPGALIRVDRKESGRTTQTLKLGPGRHNLELELAGHDNLREVIVVKPIDPMTVAFSLKAGMSDTEREQEERRSAASVRRWAATLVTLACAGLGAWQGLNSQSKLKEAKAEDVHADESQKLRSSALQSARIADASFAATAIAGGISSYLWFTVEF